MTAILLQRRGTRDFCNGEGLMTSATRGAHDFCNGEGRGSDFCNGEGRGSDFCNGHDSYSSATESDT